MQTLFVDGTKQITVFDAAGRRTASVDQANVTNWFAYDGASRLTFVTNALNKVTRYEYDEAGSLLRQIDALNRTNAFTYDNMGRRISHTMPDTSLVERFSYDLPGNLIRHTNFTGIVITNQYDALNRLTNRTAIGYQTTFGYSPTGQRTNMTDASGSTAYTYDNRDRLTNKVINWSSPVALSVSLNYRYNAGGNLTNLWSSTSSGVTNFYQYDALSRLTNVLGRDSVSAGYTFDGVGNLQTVRYGSGVTNLYQYDRLNRLTNAVWKLNVSTLGSFFYKLNLAGVRTNLDESLNGSRSYAWQYDPLYRLTNENISAIGTLGYSYDPVGNRTNRTSSVSGIGNQTPTFNTNDWLVGDVYDGNGNTRTNASNQPYFYDALNELTNFNNGAVIIGYDGDGNRVRKTAGSTTTYYLVEGRNPSGHAQVVEEHQSVSGGAATLTTVYTYGLDLVSQRRSGTVSYYIYDGHASVRALTGTGGSVTDTYQYDAYGTKLGTSTGSTANNYLYTGEQYDSDLGFYYLRARYFNPNTGRFWTMDTFEGNQSDPLSLHKYLYCADDPVNNIDPSGHEIESIMAVMNITSIGFTLSSPKGASSATAFVDRSRPLTQGEIDMSKSIFGSRIDYSKPKVLNRPWIAQSRYTAVTPNGNIYMRGDGTSVGDAGGLYRKDFSAEPNVYLRAVFIHEMTHVWQYQDGAWVKTRAAINRKYAYDYATLGTKDFKKYGLEQQASIVEDFYVLLSGFQILDQNSSPVQNPPTLQSYQKVTSTYFP